MTDTSHPQRDRLAALDPARREAVFDSALRVFGRDGYARAHTADIARGAHMSKGLLFFYFRTKRELYVRLMEHLMERVDRLVVDDGFWEVDDFFEVFLYLGRRGGRALERFPLLLRLSLDAYYPEHRDVRDAMGDWMAEQTDLMFARYFRNVRFDRFRDDVDPRHVVDLLVWLADGYLAERRRRRLPIELDALVENMEEWCALLRAYAYRKEHL